MEQGKGTKEFAPFGNPDGSRAALEEVLQGFVTFGGGARWGGLATKSDDLTARVIVGRKGSGKTIYLRRLQSFTSNQNSLYADHIQQSLPTTESIIKFCHFFEENVLTEKWMLLWHRSILRSTISHMLHSPRLAEKVDSKTEKTLVESFRPILRESRTPLSIYSQVSEIIQMCNTRHELTRFLENPLWSELEWLVAEILRDCPPICFYIDAVDEEFAHAPMYWHQCQKGLFYQTMRLLRDARLGGRLHIVICIRDIVLSSVYRSEHRTRYKEEPHIRMLHWSKEAISHFLREKINMLDDRFFVGNTKNGKDVTSWLGMKEIRNDVRGITEPLEEYLIRHTRLLPRDVVILGNALCQEVVNRDFIEEHEQFPDRIRSAVADASRFVGDEQLIICGNQITSEHAPPGAALHGYSEVYTASQEYARGIAEDLKDLVRRIGKDRFTLAELKDARESAETKFGKDADPFSVLWQNGLLGYVTQDEHANKETFSFYSATSLEDFTVPLDRQTYVFHSCLIDCAGITPSGKTPVGY